MIFPDFAKWKQTTEEVRRLGIKAEHERSRERFQALYMIGSGKSNATQWAKEINRNDRTVMDWIHRYNAAGPTSIYYKHTGGRPPLFVQVNKTR